MEQMEQIVNHVENRVRSLGENEVSTNLIGEYVMEDIEFFAFPVFLDD